MDTKSYVITATAQRDSLGNALIKCKHNASLIASAPELLEACKEALILFKHMNKSAGDFLAVELCEKAILKAGGRV